jgi:hypothetical protein
MLEKVNSTVFYARAKLLNVGHYLSASFIGLPSTARMALIKSLYPLNVQER